MEVHPSPKARGKVHIAVQYFFVMGVVKYRFHLVGQLARGKVYLQANKIFEKKLVLISNEELIQNFAFFF